ncbi:MAG: FHA domain-containing protein, partial [Chitinophagaceae bacterium]
MFDIFKKSPADVKAIRSAILQFIKDQLQKAEGGEGGNIRGIYLFFHCGEGERHLYEAAVYADEEGKFKSEEVQKIADDYAISLPESWTLEMAFGTDTPAEAVRADDVDIALVISTRKKPVSHKEATAYIRILNGEAEQEEYVLKSSASKINIGREAKAQTSDGFYRKNHIA